MLSYNMKKESYDYRQFVQGDKTFLNELSELLIEIDLIHLEYD